ncbi:hypothetical protein SBV1_3320004 [Verrucomicrobia bacterium]|nr:hypothetical protein SBV1_3320004 [Verrucomicrobiota bacterium]
MDVKLFESALGKRSPEPVVLWVARSDRTFSDGRSLSNGPLRTAGVGVRTAAFEGGYAFQSKDNRVPVALVGTGSPSLG